MKKNSKGAKSGNVLGPFQTFLDQNYWAIGRNELAIYVSTIMLSQPAFIVEIKNYKTPHNNFFKNIEKSKNNRGKIQLTRRIWSVRAIELYDELPLEISKCYNISILKVT